MYIGELARASGLSVRTLRFYADEGLLPEASRTPAGYREFAPEALARARLIRTLRELGVGLDDVRRVLAGDLTVAELAERHARALDAEIRLLRLQRTFLTVLTRVTEDKETPLMTNYSALSGEARRRVVEDYLSAVFGDGASPVAERLRLGAPELPEDPTPERVEAWVEVADLLSDPDFVEASRRMFERATAEGPTPDPSRLAEGRAVEELAGPAQRAGLDPAAPEVAAIVARIEEAGSVSSTDRLAAAERIEAFSDARVGRYWTLVGIVNGWAPSHPPEEVTAAWAWYARALRANAD